MRAIALLSCLIMSGVLADGGRPQYVVTNPVSTLKVTPIAADAGPVAQTLSMAMAKGEYEPVQVVITPGEAALKNVRVEASELHGANGATIPADRVTVEPIFCVRASNPCPEAPLKGMIPDVLLSNREIDIPAAKHQCYYITVHSTADDVPGEYAGSVNVTADGAASTTIPLKAHVYNITLPKKSEAHAAIALWGYFFYYHPEAEHDAKLYMDAYVRYAKMMLSYRLTPIVFWKPEKKADGSYDFYKYDRYIDEVVPDGVTSINIGGNGEMTGAADVEWAKAAREHFKAKGVWDMCWVYGMDEAGPEQAPNLQRMYKPLVDAVPDIRIMQTGWSPDPKLKNLVKIWCPLTQHADLAACRAAKSEGDQVWWYTCCVPSAPYANNFLDYQGVDQRILGWMTYKEGIQGYLSWAVDAWQENRRPLEDYVKANYANWEASNSGKNGDGILLYPGPNDTPVASMRMALLRDGFEDCDLFAEVAKLAADRPGETADKARELLKFDPSIIRNLTDYTKNGSDLLGRREEILKVGEELAAK